MLKLQMRVHDSQVFSKSLPLVWKVFSIKQMAVILCNQKADLHQEEDVMLPH